MSKIKIILVSLLLPALIGCSNVPTTTTTPPGNDSATTTSIDAPDTAPATDSATPAKTAPETTTPDDPTLPAGQQNRPRPGQDDPANASTPDPFQATLQGNDIYCFGQKVGQLRDDRVQMQLGERTVSFLPPEPGFDVTKLYCHVSEWNEDDYQYGNFSYLGLEVSTKLYGPYAIYKPVLTAEENSRITYKCDSPLATINEQAEDQPGHQAPFLACQTNGLNLLTQYEFNALSGSPVMVTGGEYGESWKKIFIKRGSNLNYFFIGKISRSLNDYWFIGDDIGQYRKKTSEESLNRLIEQTGNSTLISEWQEIVKSFKLEN